ncbi:hypothetical protein, partial [Salmonella enterica]|uniref:hypothetical protein n=1 Tax=Salmonella enterica TaxID=28901 RepID=UPI0019D542FB
FQATAKLSFGLATVIRHHPFGTQSIQQSDSAAPISQVRRSILFMSIKYHREKPPQSPSASKKQRFVDPSRGWILIQKSNTV